MSDVVVALSMLLPCFLSMLAAGRGKDELGSIV